MPKKPAAGLKDRYVRARDRFLNNPEICNENRELYRQFFKYEEYKLMRVNNLTKLDEGTFKTLNAYLVRFKNVNKWFKDKPLANLTKEDIKQVYDDLEEGVIKRANGKPYQAKADYYNKVFKSKLFELAGKEKLAEEVMEFYRKPKDKEVRFILEDGFRKIEQCLYKPKHKLLVWLAFDIGENVSALLKLRKSDFFRQINQTNKQPEYRVNLRSEVLKRSRTARAEITNFKETVELLDELLPDYKDDELLFPFEYSNAKMILDRAVGRSKAKCLPRGDKVSWKDLRSGMACDLLNKGWTRDEINARLGHRPSSSEIDKYINFFAIEKNNPKKKTLSYNVDKLQAELDEAREREKLMQRRMEQMQAQLERTQKDVMVREKIQEGIEAQLKETESWQLRFEQALKEIGAETDTKKVPFMQAVEAARIVERKEKRK